MILKLLTYFGFDLSTFFVNKDIVFTTARKQDQMITRRASCFHSIVQSDDPGALKEYLRKGNALSKNDIDDILKYDAVNLFALVHEEYEIRHNVLNFLAFYDSHRIWHFKFKEIDHYTFSSLIPCIHCIIQNSHNCDETHILDEILSKSCLCDTTTSNLLDLLDHCADVQNYYVFMKLYLFLYHEHRAVMFA